MVSGLIYKDILYGSSNGHNLYSPIVRVVCRHAMSRLTFALKNDSNKEMYISEFMVENSGQQNFLGNSGILDEGGILVTGYKYMSSVKFDKPSEIIINTRTTVAEIYRDPLIISAGETINYDFLIPPTVEAYDNMQDLYINNGMPKTVLKFKVTLYEYMYTTPNNKKVYREKKVNFDIEAAAWQEGHQYTYPVTLLYSSTPNPDEYVDLGLPSGTKWCTHNVGASAPEEYGGYYAWGETEEKSEYTLDNYAYYDKATNKYINIGAEISGSQYDVVHAVMGGSSRMPTKEQMEELIEYCTLEWTQLNGVNGQLVTGPNGGQIFLPAAGYRGNDNLNYAGSGGYYRSASLSPAYDFHACTLHFGSDSWAWDWFSRGYGLSVRAVCP